MKRIQKVIALGGLVMLLFSFSSKMKPITSKHLTKSYVKVPKGVVLMHPDRLRADKMDSIPLLGKAIIPQRFFDHGLDSCDEFYVFNTEVSNLNYKEFITYLPKEKRSEMMPDTNVWYSSTWNRGPMINYYFQHPAYDDYPVVGVTLDQAKAYANWLTEIYAQKNSGVKITFSIPTKKQWIRAARGAGTQPYTGGEFLRNRKGLYEINFRQMDARFIGRDSTRQKLEVKSFGASFSAFDGETFTTPVESYYPNEFGIYQMCGNVAELVSDDSVAMGGSWYDTGYDVRIESEQPAKVASSRIGFRVIATIED